MRAPPMRQPTAAPVIAPVVNCGSGEGVEVALADAEVCEVLGELGDSSDVKELEVMEVVVWGGSWIAGIVVSVPSWKVVVPVIRVVVFVGRVIVESRGSSESTVAITV